MKLETSAGRATVKLLCEVFGLSRSAYYAARKQLAATTSNVAPSPPSAPRATARSRGGAPVEALRAVIATIAAAHPAWGVRKVHALMRRKPYELRASRKRVWALMKDMGLCFPPAARPGEVPRGTVAVEFPNRRWATDLTTVWTKRDGTVAVVPVIDCGCRTLLALQVTKPQESAAILAPLSAALQRAFDTPAGVPDGLELRTDHGPQYTGEDCRLLSERWHLDHTFAPVGRPTGNAVAERVIRTLKEECIWLRDWHSIAELQEALDLWRTVYNDERPHQALNWRTPTEVRCGLTELRSAA